MLRPKPNIEKLAISSHGGIDYSKLKLLGISPEDVLDFSVNNNPWGPPAGLWDALSAARIDCYPDSNSEDLRASLAGKLKIPSRSIMITSGSTEAIRILAAAYFGAGDRILIAEPTYSEYETACQIVGATVIKPFAREIDGFEHRTGDILSMMVQYRPKGLFICNPNNPTGHYMSREEVLQILSASQECMIILDEAYVAFVENTWSSLDLIKENNLIILRSMTKEFSLAGLRLGYAVASDEIISALNLVKPPWNVNSLAQTAGIYVLRDDSYLQNCQPRINQARDFLIKNLLDLGFSVLPSRTNYFLVKVGNATGLSEFLLQKGILVRDCSSFGLPDYIRISVRTMDHCQKLIAVLKNWSSENLDHR